MPDPTPPDLDPAIYKANIAALRSIDPTLADSLDATSLPPGAHPAPTRDGHLSFTWGDSTTPQWLGGTTVPRSRARGLIDGFQSGQGNTLFVGIGAGTEAAELLARSPTTNALFILDSDLASIAMILRVIDLSAAISAQRLVMLTADDGWRQLRNFLDAHAGFLAPSRVLAWPWFTNDQHHVIAARLTKLATELSADRDAELARIRTRSAAPEGNAVAVVSLSPQPIDSHLAAGIAWGIAQLDRPSALYCADTPARMHPIALARFLADPRLANVILLNATPADLRDLLPARLQVTTWLSPNTPVPPDIAQRLADSASVVASTPAQHDALIAAGLDPNRLTLAQSAARPTQTSRRRNLLVLAPAGDDRPESAGLHLTSHVALWNATRDILAAQADQLWLDDVPAAFARAEARNNFRISDPTVRQGILDRVQSSLAPALLRNAFTNALRNAGIDVDIVMNGQLPDADTAYDAVIQLALTPEPTMEFLDAVANGARPAIRTRQGRIPPQLTDYLPPSALTPIASPADVANSLRAAPNAFAARDHVLRHHTWPERLREILKTPARQPHSAPLS